MGKSLHKKYGLKRVINASGRMSILGVSAPSNSVMEAMKEGGQAYTEMPDLVNRSGDYIAKRLGSEAAVVVNSASSGIALAVAAFVTEGNHRKSERLHQDPIAKNEIIMFKGHNVDYGAPIETMIYLGGGKLVEVGYANEGQDTHIRSAISEHTAAILYVQSHHAVQKNMLTVEETWEIAQQEGIPLIIDAAAEEDLHFFINYSDVVIYSGSKAIEGPTSGIVAGKSTYIEWLKAQLNGIGRSMKVGKEAIFGLLQALDEYDTKKDNSAQEKKQLEILTALNELGGVHVSIVQDEAGRAIFRARVKIDPDKANMTAKELNTKLREGDIAIYTRDYGVSQGFFDIDPRPLQGDDIEIIEKMIRSYVKAD